MPTAGSEFDYTIEDSSSASPIYGFMFPPSKGKIALQDFPTIAPLQRTGELTYADAPPDVEQVWLQEDWRGGLGGFNHRLHPNSYADGLKVEVNSAGEVELARDVISTTNDVNPASFLPTGFATVGTEVWSFQGREVYSWNYGTTAWVQGVRPENVSKIYRNGVEFGGNTYVPAWNPSGNTPLTYIYKSDPDVNWTLSTLAQNNFKYFAVANGSLWGGYQGTNVNQVRSSSGATNAGSWSGATSVGDTASEITSLVSDGDTLLVCKTNGIYALYRDGTVENLTPEFERNAHPNNFRGAFNWNGHVLLPLGPGGMVELRDGKLYDVSFTLVAPLVTTLTGVVAAMHGNESRLYALVQDSTNTRFDLLMAKWAEVNETNEFRWHRVGRVAYTTGTDATEIALMAEGIPSGSTIHKRAWLGVNSTGSNLTPSFIPESTDAQDAYTDDTDPPIFDTTDWDGNRPNDPKQFSEATFETKNLGSGGTAHYIEVQRRTNGGAYAFFTGTQSTSRLSADNTTLQLPVEESGRNITLRFRMFRGTTTTTTPKLVRFTLKARVRPSPVKAIPLQAYLVDGAILRNGARDYTSIDALTQLRSWNAGAVEVVLRTADGQAFDAVFVPGQYKEREIYFGRKRRRGYMVDFLLAQV